MQFSFSYDKNKTIQGLRYHFFSKKEIKVMLIVVNVFAIIAAILYYNQKIRPEPLMLGSCIWVCMMISIWFILPYTIYRKSATFKDSYNIFITDAGTRLENEHGHVMWPWDTFSKFYESPHFIHLYFDEKSFFLVPKETLTDDIKHELRGILKERIGS